MTPKPTTADPAEPLKPFILIVDPDPRLEKVLRRHPGFDAYEMMFVPDAASARRVLATRTPDWFVVESRLPDMRGSDFLKELSSLPAYADTWPLPVIYYGMIGGTERAIVPGEPGEPMMNLFKPVYPPELLLWLGRMLVRYGIVPGTPSKSESPHGGPAPAK